MFGNSALRRFYIPLSANPNLAILNWKFQGRRIAIYQVPNLPVNPLTFIDLGLSRLPVTSRNASSGDELNWSGNLMNSEFETLNWERA